MCFSASASFGAGVVLTVIGVASIKKTHRFSQLLFASIPFIFGVQQIAEGVLWLTLPIPDFVNTQKIFTYIFLFFAQILWPMWVPLAILLLEKNITRKNIQKVFVAAGFIVGIYLAYCLFTYNVEAQILGQHISYLQDYPNSLKSYVIVLYALATLAPPFFSHIKRMWILGTTVAISYIIAYIFYEHYILSVWCFFSSIISLSIYAIMIEISNTQKLKNVKVI
ncbi:hypothetical protein EGI22_12435 [Lacihabitans sp. LS3-19]|uniref:DUF6629 family protein n=1 Tax=Lacihabitans sp. LS3-19 TaxID=2487335 RepID=UPI0020CC47B4|nr:DUF6629 family protein [Lacihabitans sp. LS3-19]MCP9768725.1 hypothetical protein [Lacihabitans sp. LS3-19]